MLIVNTKLVIMDATYRSTLESRFVYSRGPGSLHMHILDTLYSLDQATLEQRAHLLMCEEVAA